MVLRQATRYTTDFFMWKYILEVNTKIDIKT